ncbi:MAG: hypothetical protein JWL95_3184 [Gemmatimonadetes bacterium]|nr:hypothetical protein [Gemmatimonadota bacterium]
MRSSNGPRASLMQLLRPLSLCCALSACVSSVLAAQEHDVADEGQKTIIHGFADINYLTGGNNTGRTSAFGLGQFDLYITSRISDRLSFLGETVFEHDDKSSQFVVDVERVIAQYALTDHLRVEAGKVHTPLGYWNNAYHHGLALQPTITRPQLVQFEDDGGPLPIHTVGVQLSGRDLSVAHLGFDVLLGNPLGNRPTTDNRNEAASVTLALHSQVTSSLRVGVSGYRDNLRTGSPTPSGDTLNAPMTQTIGGGFVAYFSDRAEAVLEGHQVSNRSVNRTTSSPNWFVYAGYRLADRVVPYVVHEEVRLSEGDPYFASDRFRRETGGIRFEQSAGAVVKLEIRSIDRRTFQRATELALQVALAY